MAGAMRARGQTGSIVTLLCDAGERYLDTYHDPAWVAECFGDIAPVMAELDARFGGAA